MRIVSALDSFKGSISSEQANQIVKDALKHHDVVPFPIADGGEGTVAVYVSLTNGKLIEQPMSSINLLPSIGTWGWNEANKTAVIEAAEGAGILHANPKTFHPRNHTSYGVGQQISQALDKGAETIIIGLGGTGTNDGGIGMLQALGCRFYREDGLESPILPLEIEKIKSIDRSALDRRIKDTTFIIASDVTNPLCGPNGATAVFGKQKGLLDHEIEEWDRAMKHYEETVSDTVNKKMGAVPGSGAAGGIGFALLSFLDSHIQSGFDLLAQIGKLENLIASADLVITGEGKFDSQSLQGKVTSSISHLAKSKSKPTLLFVGSVEDHLTSLVEENIHAIIPIVDSPMPFEDAIKNGPILLGRAVQRSFSLIELIQKNPLQ